MEKKTNFKYIVFVTTNIITNEYYFGIHYTNVNKYDFFIGSGIYTTDPYTYQFSKTPLQEAVKHYGVKNFLRSDFVQTKDKNKAISIYRQLMTEYHLTNPKCYNTCIIPDEDCEFHIYAADGGKYVKTITGNYIKYYESAFCGNCFKENGKYFYVSFVKDERYDRARKMQIQRREVFQYDGLTGEFLNHYDSQEEAEKDNKYSNITKSIKLNTFDKNGYIWSLFYFDKYNKLKHQQKIKLQKDQRRYEKIAKRRQKKLMICSRQLGN